MAKQMEHAHLQAELQKSLAPQYLRYHSQGLLTNMYQKVGAAPNQDAASIRSPIGAAFVFAHLPFESRSVVAHDPFIF